MQSLFLFVFSVCVAARSDGSQAVIKVIRPLQPSAPHLLLPATALSPPLASACRCPPAAAPPPPPPTHTAASQPGGLPGCYSLQDKEGQEGKED